MLEKKKIIILLPSMGSGGAEKVMSLFLQKLVEDYKIYLVLFFNNIHYQIPDDVTVICISDKNNLNVVERILLIPRIIIKYLIIIKTEKIGISVSMLTIPNFINALVNVLNKNLKGIGSERCFPSIEYKSTQIRYKLYKILIPFFYNKLDFLFSNSIHINEDLKKSFNVSKKMDVIYNPIKLNNNYLQKIDKGNKTFRIIHVSRFIPVKNHEMLLKAIEIVTSPIHVDLVGDGELLDVIKKSSIKMKISSKINFHGNVKDVYNKLLNSDCFVFTSLSEGFPNALLEAMSAGLPVISTNCLSGPLELLNRNNEVVIPTGGFVQVEFGILVNVNDSLGLSSAIEFLISSKEIQQHYCLQSRRRAEDFSLDIIYNKIKNIIDK